VSRCKCRPYHYVLSPTLVTSVRTNTYVFLHKNEAKSWNYLVPIVLILLKPLGSDKLFKIYEIDLIELVGIR
jgi:hypothetical protein